MVLWRVLAIHGYTLAPGRLPPSPGFAPCASSVSYTHLLSLRNLLAAILILLAILTLLIVWGLVNQGLHTAKPAESTQIGRAHV